MTNAAQQNLLYAKEASDESWQGTWAEIAANMTRSSPFLTLPREIARLEGVVVCDQPVALNNQFGEYLRFGNGRMSANRCRCPNDLGVYARNNAVTFTDLTPGQYIRAYLTNSQDVGRRVLIQGNDTNDLPVFSQQNLIRVTGMFLALDTVPVTTDIAFNSLSGIQKDQTSGQVQIYGVDATTGAETLLLTMQPSETTASYRRYFFSALPCSCCPVPNATDGTVQVKAIAKLDLVPVQVDTDYCLLQSLEAIIEEGQSIRLMEADTMAAQQMSAVHHQRAVRLLIGQLSHYEGVDNPAVGFAPFGNDWSNPIGPRGGSWNATLGMI